MGLLIDGYNLIHAAGILGRGIGPGGLERARHALLNFLAESVDPRESSRTTVVFDAAAAPPGLSRNLRFGQIHVRFASEYENADALIEQLIQEDSSPRRLVVVSSDHRVQRAARRRRATAIDSDVWFAETIRQRRQRQDLATAADPKPAVPLAESEVQYWLDRFIAEQVLEDPNPERLELEDPFPPGYAEDLP